jgi:hypothetical protein
MLLIFTPPTDAHPMRHQHVAVRIRADVEDLVLALGRGQQLGQGLVGRIALDDDRGASDRHAVNRPQVLEGVVGQVLGQHGHDAHRRGAADEHRVAVGRGLLDELDRQQAAAARPVLDHHGLAEAARHHLAVDAGGTVRTAARVEGHHDADGLAGEGGGLGAGHAMGQGRGEPGGGQPQQVAAFRIVSAGVIRHECVSVLAWPFRWP